jgi:hypothetical protein
MSPAVRWYIFAASATALAVALPAAWSRDTDPVQLLVLCVLMAFVERRTRIEFAARITMSVSLVVAFAAMSLLPPSSATVVGLVSGMQSPVGTSKLKAAFNIAMHGLVMAGGSAVCGLLGGHEHEAAKHFPGYFLPYFSGVTTSWLCNGLLLAGVLSLSGVATFRSVVSGDLVRFALPYYGSAVLALIFVVLWQQIAWFTALLVIVPMYASHWVFSQYSREQKAYEETVSALVQAVEIKDHYTRGHSERVAKGAELIARRLALPEDRISKLRYAGLLHDIGKLGIPTRLLAKPGKLTDEEFQILAQHPNQGVAVIRDIRFLTDVYDGILYHHERLDGRGYPTGKSGDQIPLFARVLGVADAFDAMTSTRSYRAARPVPEALEELWRGAGTQFDPELVRAFAEALELQERAGHPWQVTDEPVRLPDDLAAVGAPTEPGSAYIFEDHDDPMVEAAWFAERDGLPGAVRESAPGTVHVEVLGVVREEPPPGSLPPAAGPAHGGALPSYPALPALEPLSDRGEDAPTAELFLFPSGKRHKGFAPRLPVDRRRPGSEAGASGPESGQHAGAGGPGARDAHGTVAPSGSAPVPEPLPRRLDPAAGNYHDLRHAGSPAATKEPAVMEGATVDAVVGDQEATP